MSASGEGLLATCLLSSALLLRRLCRWRAWDGPAAKGSGRRRLLARAKGLAGGGSVQGARGQEEESVLTPGEARARRGRSEAAGEERRMNGRREAGEARPRSVVKRAGVKERRGSTARESECLVSGRWAAGEGLY